MDSGGSAGWSGTSKRDRPYGRSNVRGAPEVRAIAWEGLAPSARVPRSLPDGSLSLAGRLGLDTLAARAVQPNKGV